MGFTLVTRFSEISPGIYVSGEVERRTEFEHADERLMVRRGDSWESDPLKDDMSLLLETDSGPVVLLGCAHAGAVNILNHFKEKTGHERFFAVIGGTHLDFLKGDQLEQTIAAFSDYGIEVVAASHCTGLAAAAVMLEQLKTRFHFANVGWSMVL